MAAGDLLLRLLLLQQSSSTVPDYQPCACSGAAHPGLQDKIWELRFYNFNLAGAAAFRRMVQNPSFLKARNGSDLVLGIWEVQLNGFAEFFHIHGYDNLDHLLRLRQAGFGSEALRQEQSPLADVQWTFRNYLTVLAPGSHLCTDFTPSDSAVYELQTVPEGSLPTMLDSNGGRLVGRFLSVYGPSKTEYRLIRYPNAASAQADAVARRQYLPRGWDTRLMEPMSVSNLQ